MDGSLPGFSVHRVSQARIVEWVAISSSRGPSCPRDINHVSCVSCIGRRILYLWTIRESQCFLRSTQSWYFGICISIKLVRRVSPKIGGVKCGLPPHGWGWYPVCAPHKSPAPQFSTNCCWMWFLHIFSVCRALGLMLNSLALFMPNDRLYSLANGLPLALLLELGNLCNCLVIFSELWDGVAACVALQNPSISRHLMGSSGNLCRIPPAGQLVNSTVLRAWVAF